MTDKQQSNITSVTIGMEAHNLISMTLSKDGVPLGSILLNREAAENVMRGLSTHIGYLRPEKMDA